AAVCQSSTLRDRPPGGVRDTVHVVGVGGLFRDGHQRREVSGESPRDQYGRRRRALQRHVHGGIGDAHEQSRRCSERPRARPKRALRVQSVPVLVATELLPRLPLRLWVVLRLRTKLLPLRTRLRLWTKLPAVPLKAASRRKLKALPPAGVVRAKSRSNKRRLNSAARASERAKMVSSQARSLARGCRKRTAGHCA